MPWLLAVAFLLLYEMIALATGRRTLSRMVWNATRAWPPLPFVAGIAVGGLAVHFWWPLCF
jgi:hypothetical protein